jgi:hypothetical protein
MQAAVPLLNVETDYHEAHQTYEDCVAVERRHDEVAAQIWPHGPMGWLGLVASYVILLCAILLGLAYVAPTWMPPFLVALVRPAPPPEDRLPEVVINGVRIAVKDVTIDHGFETIFPMTDQPPNKSEALILRIVLELTNTTDEPVRYITWRGHRAYRNSSAYLLDDKGRRVDPYVSSDRQMPQGGVYEVVIPAHGKAQDVLHIGSPDPMFEFLDLFLPCVNLNPDKADRDVKRTRLARDLIKKPGDKVKE